MNGRVLVVDVGTSSVRASVIDGEAHVVTEHRSPLLPSTPAPGLVEFDATEMARVALDLAAVALAEAGPVDAVGIANQRASTVVWDRATGVPVGPGLGWQDLRTIGRCLELAADDVRFAPNQSATKFEHLLDAADPDRTRDLCVGTVDSWIAWNLSEGAAHVTDGSNAQVTALRTADNADWASAPLERLRIPRDALPTVVETAGVFADATALDGAPPLAGLVGDQQASLLGQGCVRPGDAKITFGTGGMLDVVLGVAPARLDRRGDAGTFPIVTRRVDGTDHWGLEAVMLSAGTCIEWLRDDLALIGSVEESDTVAAGCDDTGDVWFVPALLGLGTPHWDYGARGTLVGLTRGTKRAQVVRAVLEGIAHRGADLVDAAERDADLTLERLRVDGGMAGNQVFLAALASATQRPIEVAPVREATALGAAFCAGRAVGLWADDEHIAATWRPAQVVDPGSSPNRVGDRSRWQDAVARAGGWIPGLSALDF